MGFQGSINHPLHWPRGRPRTPHHKRERSPFEVSLTVAIDHMFDELRKLGARYVALSSDLEGYETKNGIWRPYHDAKCDDPGVAVYFDLDTDPIVFSSDKYEKVEANVRAIGLTIESMRRIERYGVAERKMAFQGFKALPAAGEDWRSVLGLVGNVDMRTVKTKYRQLAAAAHPDQAGGNEHEMQRLNAAVEAAKKELNS